MHPLKPDEGAIAQAAEELAEMSLDHSQPSLVDGALEQFVLRQAPTIPIILRRKYPGYTREDLEKLYERKCAVMGARAELKSTFRKRLRQDPPDLWSQIHH